MAEPWVGIINTIAPRYLKGAVDLTRRKRIWLPLMEKRGKVHTGESGQVVYWTVQYKEHPVTSYADGASIEFNRHDLYRPCVLDPRAYQSTDSMTEMEKAMYSDDVGIVNRYSQIIPTMTSSVQAKLGAELYIDGNAAGNENRWHGIASFTGADESNTTSHDLVAYPSDSYAGNSTVPGAYGSWSANRGASQGVGSGYPNAAIAKDWPEGQGDVGFDYWTPILLNTSCIYWVDGSTTNWGAADGSGNSEAVLRRVVQYLSNNAASEPSALYCLMAGDMFSQFKDKMSYQRRVLVPHKEAEDLGFPETLNFEGMGIKSEFDTPSGTFNAINFSQVELSSYWDKLVTSTGPDWSPEKAAWLFRVKVMGNLKWMSPKFFAHGEAYA